MTESIKIGDYGRFHFTLKKKGMSEKMGFNVVATVVEIDKQFVLLRDNDDIPYLPRRADIDKFKRRFKNE